MKTITSIILAGLLLMGCASDDGMMPRSNDATSAPWGYEDMCNDPARRSPEHCD